MLSFSSFQLDESILNIGFNPKHEHFREQHRQDIHDILKSSYRHIGYGGNTPNSKEESDAIHHDITHSSIKAVRRNGKISAVALYKRTHGRKQIAGGTDGTIRGKRDWLKTAHEDYVTQGHHRNAWVEASGGPKKMMVSLKAKPIPKETMKKLLPDKELHDAEPEKGEHAYKRKIGHGLHTKYGFGNPKIDEGT